MSAKWASNVDKVAKPSAVPAKKIASVDPLLQNPKGFGGRNSAGQVIPSKTAMFNDKGEMNAYSKKDAIENQELFMDLMNLAKTRRASAPLTKEDAIQAKYLERVASASNPGESVRSKLAEQAMLGNMLSSSEGRMKLAAGQVPLILSTLDYEGFARNVLLAHSVAQGEIISYEKDIAVSASMIEEDGKTIRTQVRGNRIFPNEFWITALNTINKGEIARKQYDIVDRAHDKTVYQIMLKEDRNALRLLYQSASIDNDLINFSGASIDKSAIETLVLQVEQNRLLVDKILMNRSDWGSLRKNINSTDFDPLTSRDTMLTGMFGKIWNHKIMVTAGISDVDGIPNQQSVPAGMMFAVTEPRYLGAMPVRIELEVQPADQFVNGSLEYGWLFNELIGQVIVNPKAVACLVRNGTTVPTYLS